MEKHTLTTQDREMDLAKAMRELSLEKEASSMVVEGTPTIGSGQESRPRFKVGRAIKTAEIVLVS